MKSIQYNSLFMNKFLSVVIIIVSIVTSVYSQPGRNEVEVKEIKKIMQQQEDSWNRGDIEAFMQGYLKSDSLLFVGGKGAVYGWSKTLKNYLASYPNKKKMGVLRFENIKIEVTSTNSAFVVGKWQLD